MPLIKIHVESDLELNVINSCNIPELTSPDHFFYMCDLSEKLKNYSFDQNNKYFKLLKVLVDYYLKLVESSPAIHEGRRPNVKNLRTPLFKKLKEILEIDEGDYTSSLGLISDNIYEILVLNVKVPYAVIRSVNIKLVCVFLEIIRKNDYLINKFIKDNKRCALMHEVLARDSLVFQETIKSLNQLREKYLLEILRENQVLTDVLYIYFQRIYDYCKLTNSSLAVFNKELIKKIDSLLINETELEKLSDRFCHEYLPDLLDSFRIKGDLAKLTWIENRYYRASKKVGRVSIVCRIFR